MIIRFPYNGTIKYQLIQIVQMYFCLICNKIDFTLINKQIYRKMGNLRRSVGTLTFKDDESIDCLLEYRGVVDEKNQVWNISYSLYNRTEFDKFYSRLNEIRIKSIIHKQVEAQNCLRLISRIKFPSLKILALPNNNIETLQYLSNMNAPHLQVLDFKNNHISSISFLRKINELSHLDISGNKIHEINEAVWGCDWSRRDYRLMHIEASHNNLLDNTVQIGYKLKTAKQMHFQMKKCSFISEKDRIFVGVYKMKMIETKFKMLKQLPFQINLIFQ